MKNVEIGKICPFYQNFCLAQNHPSLPKAWEEHEFSLQTLSNLTVRNSPIGLKTLEGSSSFPEVCAR